MILVGRRKINDNDDKPAIMVHGDDAMIDMEVLGQGGPFPRKVMKNYDRKLRPDLDPADLPVPRSLRKQMTKNNREGELAALEKPLPRAGLFQESEVHERPLDTKVGYPERADSRLLHVPASRGRDDEDTRQTRKDIGGFHVQNQKPTRRSNVLIVAAMRTGSSFVGELFQQRRDFFYMFEPGLLLMDKLDSLNLTRRIMVTKLIVMLNRFYQCRFDSMSFFIDLLNKKSLFSRKQVVPAIVTTQFCRKFPKSLHRVKVACPPVTERLLQTACQSRDHTAIKSIRILDINLMLDAIRNPEVDLKLLHLVRDPRSMIVSRLRLLHPKIAVFNESHLSSTQRNILDRYCSNWLQNYEVGHYVPSMRKNYLLVRYEDVALDPLKSAEVIYDFVGLGATIPSGVQNWVAQNTKVNDPSKKKSAAFSTKRDSRSVLVSWKRRITTELARAIEHVGDCPRLMQVIGYTPIGSDSAKLDDDDDLVATLPDPL